MSQSVNIFKLIHSHLFIAFYLALLPAIFWVILYYRQDHQDPEPKRIIAELFLMGILTAIPFLLIRYILLWLSLDSLLLTGVISVFIFAAIEEMAKLSAAVYIIDRHQKEFNQLIDGVLYAIIVAIGFAFVENIFYLTSFLDLQVDWFSFLGVVAFRGLGTMLAHTLFSAVSGLIWAYAYFSKQITPFQRRHLLAFELEDWLNHEMVSLHIIRQNILKARPSRRGGHEKKVLVMEGLMLSVFLHTIFNLMTTIELFGQNLTFLIVPILIAGVFYVCYLFTKKFNNKILQVV